MNALTALQAPVRRRPAASRPALHGVVEAAVPLPAGGGWLLSGWTPQRWEETEAAGRLSAGLTVGNVTGPATTAFHDRSDVPAGSVGFATVLMAPCPAGVRLTGLELAGSGLRLATQTQLRMQPAEEIAARCRRAIRAAAAPGATDHPILELLPRPAFDGRDSVAGLWPPVHLEFDSAIRVPPTGLALAGWFLDPAGSVQALRVRGSAGVANLDMDNWVAVRRPDIMETLGQRYGLDHDRLGLLAYAPGVVGADGQAWLELETREGAIAYKPLRTLERPALGAIKQFLSGPQPQGPSLQSAFDTVLGPIVEGLNRARLARPCRRIERAFGDQPTAPQTSLVVTLHGRLDFMEYQQALFCERPDPTAEILYVLDDPALTDEAARLANSCWARFRLPFRFIALAENLGYAPANNVGLRAAHGRFACLMNSDVFPIGASGLSWLAPLAHRLAGDATLGLVAPLLVYEDGTVQHRGMHYERLPSCANWPFPMHTGKGGELPAPGVLLDVPAVSGACVLARRDDLLADGGLDEAYLIGDFEDSDLCLRFRAAGQRCAVDTAQRLYHLERQSQGEGQPWRANVTLYNAWRHNRRWGDGLHAEP